MIKKESSAFSKPESIKKSSSKFDIIERRFRGEKFFGHVGGYPIMYDNETQSLILDPSDNHQLVLGATGSKKTRAIIMPAIKVLAYAGESMIIHDTKGELFSEHSQELADLGYNVVTLSLRDPSVGNAWNPLKIPYMYYQQGDMDKACEFANDIARSICIANMENSNNNDPYWTTAAADTFFGLTLLLMEYVSEGNYPATEVNLANLIKLKRELFNNKNTNDPKRTDIWKWASQKELVYASLSGTVLTASDTRAGVISVLDAALRSFVINETLTTMLSNNNIDIALTGEEKTAIFLITPDEKTSMHGIVTLFVQQSYQYLIYKAIECGGKLNVRVNYILDEFTSLPEIGDSGNFVAMISAARSRNIRYLIACQSFGALKKRYGDEKDAIVANCTNLVFFFSREIELLQYLSDLCGKKNDGKPNITISELQQLDKNSNQALVFTGRMKPMIANFIDIDDKKMGKSKGALPLLRADREKAGNIDFSELPESAKKIVDKLNQPTTNPFSSPVFDFNQSESKKTPNESKDGKSKDDLDIDALIKKIDEKIEDFEQQEELSKRITERAKEIDSKKEG